MTLLRTWLSVASRYDIVNRDLNRQEDVLMFQQFLRCASIIAFFGMAAIVTRAQDSDLVRHFDYDQKAPLNIKHVSVQRRATATIYDITYDSPKGGVVPAYLVVPKGRGPFAAVIWGHWCWTNSSLKTRKQFLDEAVTLAQSGLVSLLPDHPISRPGYVEVRNPLDERRFAVFLQQVIDMRRGVDLLISRRDVDPKRIAYVGHSCGASVGALLSGLDRRFKAFVLMAGSMSDELAQSTPDFQEFRRKVGAEKVDALIKKYHYLDQGKFVSHAAPAVVLLQFATQEEEALTPERAKQHAAIVSEPKIFKLYEAPHALNAEARRDRIRFLIEQLKLRPVSDARISAIPDLYQPPAPN